MYLQRRNLRGLALKRFTVALPEQSYEDLQKMKGTLGNSAAIDKMIREKKSRIERRGRAVANSPAVP
jgi:predicted CopG family antitoxin